MAMKDKKKERKINGYERQKERKKERKKDKWQ